MDEEDVKFSKQIHEEYNVSFTNQDNSRVKIVGDVYKAVKAAKAILKNKDGLIPDDKINYLKDTLKSFLNKDELTNDDIKNGIVIYTFNIYSLQDES